MKLPLVSSNRKPSTHVIALVTILLVSVVGQCSSVEQAAATKQTDAVDSSKPAATAVAAPSETQAKSSAPAALAKSLPAEAPSSSSKQEQVASEQDAAARKGRSESPPTSGVDTKATEKVTEKSEKPTSKPAGEKKDTASKQAPSSPSNKSAPSASHLAGKSGASSSKKILQNNLGTVTSTGSGGPTHYMSQHDTYSAIAEKHGALAQGAMRKSDKRRLQHSFGGIQKASGGIGDMLNPFRGVTESELARTLGASVRSIIKGKYSVPAYVASALLGAVALMAFYESPISPLPVPPLPEPPVGRFPPEMPSLPPGTQVPFRGNFNQQQQQQQGGYNGYGNQRALQLNGYAGQQQQPQQQQQQVLFPGNSNVAQQRSSDGAPAGGPVQQLAANLLSTVGAKPQAAQRKSGLDYDPSSSRSFFGSGAAAGAKLGSPANQQKQQNSILSFFGFGGSSETGAASSSAHHPPGQHSLFGSDIQQASSNLNGLLNSPLSAALSAIEPKGQSASGLSNSHVVNKVKSYFNMRPAHGHSHSATSAATAAASANPYDEYSRMSFVQALMKDTAFLPAFLNPTRKSSSPSSSSSSSAQSSSSPSQSAASAQPAAARMQVDRQPILPNLMGLSTLNQQQSAQQPLAQQQQIAPPANSKRASSGFGLVRAADRIAHALLDTFTSGLMQGRSTSGQQQAEQKKLAAEQQSPLLSATSLLTDIMSSYNTQSNANQIAMQPEYQISSSPQQAQPLQSEGQQQQHQVSQQQAAPVSGQQQQKSAAAPAQQQQSTQSDVAMGRSMDSQQVNQPSGGEQQAAPKQQPEAAAAAPPSSSTTPQQQQQQLVRKTRSIGLDYPLESNHALARYEQQQSRAAQINNLVDFVADSYSQNRLLFNFVMNQVGLSQAVPYVEQILASNKENNHLV